MDKSKNIIKPDYLSQVTHQLQIGFSPTGTIFSSATGFLYTFDDRVFLITNWHNATGRNPISGESLSKSHAGIPDTFWIYLRENDGTGSSKLQNIPLYEDENMTKPLWLVHPQHREKVDVVAIELDRKNEFVYSYINKFKFDNEIRPEVGDDVFIIGYPFKEMRFLGLPIWKRGSIATEPQVNEGQLPKMLVDTATRSGLSGSPVIYQRTGVHINNSTGEVDMNTKIGRIRGFLGIYSGRIGKDELKAQLGIVWKRHAIEEIIAGNTFDNINFQKA